MAVDMFLKISGIPGESTIIQHEGEIDVESFSWDLSPDPAGGKGLQVGDFEFAKRADKASPILMLSCAVGKRMDEAVLTIRRLGEVSFDFLKFELTNVVVTSYQTGGSSGDVLPVDNFSLNFQSIKQTYTRQKEDGSREDTQTSFNVKDVKR